MIVDNDCRIGGVKLYGNILYCLFHPEQEHFWDRTNGGESRSCPSDTEMCVKQSMGTPHLLLLKYTWFFLYLYKFPHYTMIA